MMDVIHMLICAKKTNLKIQNLKILCASHLIQLVLLIDIQRIKVHLSLGYGSYPPF